MQLGMRPRVPFSLFFRGFRMILTHGRVYALPAYVEPKEVVVTGVLFSHPAALAAATREELELLIDQKYPEGPGAAIRRGRSMTAYDLVRYRGEFHGVPFSSGLIDLASPKIVGEPGLSLERSREEVEAQFEARNNRHPWSLLAGFPSTKNRVTVADIHSSRTPRSRRLAIASLVPRRRNHGELRLFGTGLPPAVSLQRRRLANKIGAFTRLFLSLLRPVSGVTLQARLRMLAAFARLGTTLLRNGAGPAAVWQFLHTRHLRSQLLLSPHRGLVFSDEYAIYLRSESVGHRN